MRTRPIAFSAVFFLLFMAFILKPATGYAYSVQTHRQITQQAIAFYNLCAHIQNRTPITQPQSQLIESGNVWEDLDVPRKMTHWHFYHPEKTDLGKGLWGIGQGSLTSRFSSIEQLLATHPQSDWEEMGRLTHYIQDMTNPAHVAPIYHLGDDRFDNYPFESLLKTALDLSDCESFNGNGNDTSSDLKLSYLQLLDQTARTTLRRLEQSFAYQKKGTLQTVTWAEAFWSSDFDPKLSQQKNFGHYGTFGNHFGETTIGEVQITKFEYTYFAKMQIRAALVATLLYLDKFVTERKLTATSP